MIDAREAHSHYILIWFSTGALIEKKGPQFARIDVLSVIIKDSNEERFENNVFVPISQRTKPKRDELMTLQVFIDIIASTGAFQVQADLLVISLIID